jgi:hypothetical protein
MDGVMDVFDVGTADTEDISEIPVTQRRHEGVSQGHHSRLTDGAPC